MLRVECSDIGDDRGGGGGGQGGLSVEGRV